LSRIDHVPKFQFSLETLLRHREDIEQKERDELFQRTCRYQNELRHREDLGIKLRDTMKELSARRSGTPDEIESSWFYLYLNRLTHEIGESEKCLARLQAEVQAQKAVAIEATQKRKVLASLKAKQEKEFVFAMEKREQREVDDLVVTRHGARESRYEENIDHNSGADVKHDP